MSDQSGRVLSGQIGSFGPRMNVVQTDAVESKPGRTMVFGIDPGSRPSDCFTTVAIPATRPSLRLPLTEALAAKHKIDLWYFDRTKWPERERVDAADYLGIRRTDV